MLSRVLPMYQVLCWSSERLNDMSMQQQNQRWRDFEMNIVSFYQWRYEYNKLKRMGLLKINFCDESRYSANQNWREYGWNEDGTILKMHNGDWNWHFGVAISIIIVHVIRKGVMNKYCSAFIAINIFIL